MKRVIQKHYDKGDCGIACAAMLAGVTYDESLKIAVRAVLKRRNGKYLTSHTDLVHLLRKLRVSVVRRRFTSMRETLTPSIVKVNPTRDGRYWHWIVLTSRSGKLVLLDPNPKCPGAIRSFRGYHGRGVYLNVA